MKQALNGLNAGQEAAELLNDILNTGRGSEGFAYVEVASIQ